MKSYIFIRKDGFYPLVLLNDEDAKYNAEINEDTIRVEDLEGNIIWESQD